MFIRISKRKIQKAFFSVPLVLIVSMLIYSLTLYLELRIYTELGISRLLGNIWMMLLLFFVMFTLPLFVALSLAPCVFVLMAPKMVNPPENVKASLRMMAKKSGARIRWINFIDYQVKNALCTGMGWPGYGVFLFSGLMSKLSEEELIAVGVHEVAHARHNHPIKNLLNSVFILGLAFFLTILSLFLMEGLGYTTLIPAVALIMLMSSLVLLFFICRRFSRGRELEADIFAKKWGKGAALASALRKISPKKTTWFRRVMSIFDFHPTLKERERVLR